MYRPPAAPGDDRPSRRSLRSPGDPAGGAGGPGGDGPSGPIYRSPDREGRARGTDRRADDSSRNAAYRAREESGRSGAYRSPDDIGASRAYRAPGAGGPGSGRAAGDTGSARAYRPPGSDRPGVYRGAGDSGPGAGSTGWSSRDAGRRPDRGEGRDDQGRVGRDPGVPPAPSGRSSTRADRPGDAESVWPDLDDLPTAPPARSPGAAEGPTGRPNRLPGGGDEPVPALPSGRNRLFGGAARSSARRDDTAGDRSPGRRDDTAGGRSPGRRDDTAGGRTSRWSTPPGHTGTGPAAPAAEDPGEGVRPYGGPGQGLDELRGRSRGDRGRDDTGAGARGRSGARSPGDDRWPPPVDQRPGGPAAPGGQGALGRDRPEDTTGPHTWPPTLRTGDASDPLADTARGADPGATSGFHAGSGGGPSGRRPEAGDEPSRRPGATRDAGYGGPSGRGYDPRRTTGASYDRGTDPRYGRGPATGPGDDTGTGDLGYGGAAGAGAAFGPGAPSPTGARSMTRGWQPDLHAAPSAWPPDAPPLPGPPPAPGGPLAPGRPDGPGGPPAPGGWDPYAPPPYGTDPDTGSETGLANGVDLDERYGGTGVDLDQPYGGTGVDLDQRYGGTGVDELEYSGAGHGPDDDADDGDGADHRRRPTGPKAPAELDDAPRLPDIAGFDGLRGLALIAVLLFHQGWDAARGGFLGISSFFTLSGFLLATLALAEWAQTGRLALGRLWERRARRLVPAYVAVLALVIVLQFTLRVGTGPGFRADMLWAAAWATNWHAVLADRDVAGIFLDPSPVQHLWSLAVLAQLVVVMPLLFVGLMKVAGRHWRLGGAVFGLVAVLSFVLAKATAEVDGNGGLAYYGTHTRAGEVLVGVALAYCVLSPAMRRVLGSELGVAAARYGAVGALAALAVLWSRTSLGDPNLFAGITALNAVLTALVILAVTAPGPAATFLGTWPLRMLGRISYTAYLAHWPIYLLIDEPRLDLPGPALFGLRVAATLAVATALHVALEQPFRTKLRMPRRRLAGALMGATAVVLVVAVIVPLKPPVGVSLAIDDGEGPGDLDVVVPTASEVASVALVGDALASSIVPGFAVWNDEHADDQMRLDTHVTDDCPPGAPGPVRLAGETIGEQTGCTGWEPRLPELLDATSADVVVVVTGLGELGDREIDGAWRHLGDPLYDSWLATQLDELAGELADAGVPVLWATIPHVRLPGANGDWTRWEENDPQRVDRYNELVRAAADGHDLEVVDMTAWAQELPRGGEFSTDYRQDGATFTETGARVAADWIAREVLRIIDS